MESRGGPTPPSRSVRSFKGGLFGCPRRGHRSPRAREGSSGALALEKRRPMSIQAALGVRRGFVAGAQVAHAHAPGALHCGRGRERKRQGDFEARLRGGAGFCHSCSPPSLAYSVEGVDAVRRGILLGRGVVALAPACSPPRTSRQAAAGCAAASREKGRRKVGVGSARGKVYENLLFLSALAHVAVDAAEAPEETR